MGTITIQSELLKSMLIHKSKTAIEDGEQKISYATLLARANAITSFCLKYNLAKETRIGVCVQDRAAIITSIIGIMNAGCVFVLIDGTLPEKRLEAIVSDLQLQYVITANSTTENNVIQAKVADVFLWEDIIENGFSETDQLVYPDFNASDSLYIYFTSGTTGKPKGIVGVNKSLLHFIQWEITEFKITDSDRFSQFISPYFDAFLRDIFVPLLSGATICLPDVAEDMFAPERLSAWIDQKKLTLIHCVPSLFRSINNEQLHADQYHALKNVLLSGEKIIPSELKNWYNVFGASIQLVNLYGATETTMIRSFYRIQPNDVNLVRIPIGISINDTELLILKEDLRPCGMLVTGELYIVSDYMTKGYLNDPELNKTKFIQIQSPTKGEVTAYKTGDKARLLANRTIDLLGREDRQIKLRGIRVELDEIELLLQQSELVKQVVVTVVTENTDDPYLVAFVLPKEVNEGGEELIAALKAYAKVNMPAYMIPFVFSVIAAYPLLSNGKIDYKELLNVQKAAAEIMILPVNSREEKLLAIWKDILGDKSISTDASFQSMGGSSLGVMKLIAKIYKEFGIRIALNELFNNLTISKQSQLIIVASKDDSMTIKKGADQPAYHLTAAQERIYFIYALNPNSTAYNLPMAWEINGAIDEARIQKAFTDLLKRHDILRTSFKVEDGNILQVIENTPDVSIEEITSTEADAHKAIIAFIKPFDLSKAPLIRCGIILLPSQRRILVMDIHHIVCDGMSQQNLYADFLRLYKQEELMPLPVQYKDYAEWEHHFKTTHQYISLREFWLKEFENRPQELILPTVNTTGNNNDEEGGNVHFKIERVGYEPLLEVLNKEGITLFSGLFSLFHIFLSQLSGQEDFVIGINTAGRIQEELEGMVGMFVKTLPIRNKLNAEKSYKDFVKQVHTHFVKCNSNQLYDLADIISELNKDKDPLLNKLFQVMFVFQNFERKTVHTEEIEFIHYDFENKTFKYPITLFATEGADGLYFRFEFAASYFTRKDVELLVSQFKELVEIVINNLDTPIIDYTAIDSQPALQPGNDEIEFKF